MTVVSHMRKRNHGFIDIILMALAPLILMIYGWHLGQLHQSGYDVAGIFLFITGVAGLLLASGIRYFTQRYRWTTSWLASFLTGVASCGIVFILILMFARLHG
jgi:hypothetical protein